LGKNRDRLSIVADVLEVAKSGASKTRIMFRANLSFNLLEKYLDVTLAAGFVRLVGSSYELTENGFDFLNGYKDFLEHDAQARKLLEDLNFEWEKLSRLCGVAKQVDPITDVEIESLGLTLYKRIRQRQNQALQASS